MNLVFVPKPKFGKNPWVEFGSIKSEYERWIPHICGICCLKMIGDTYGFTTSRSLYDLTLECYAKNGFTIKDDDNIFGVYHYPLLDLAKQYGMNGSVEGALDLRKIRESIKKGLNVILSVSVQVKKKIENHLIVVHGYRKKTNEFIIHDCAYILGETGQNIFINAISLQNISNNKGLLLYGKVMT